MWVLTRQPWPTLVNLARLRGLSYQQISKTDLRVRVLATGEQPELSLADCEDGDQAQALVRAIAEALEEDRPFLDLTALDRDTLARRGW